MTAGVDVTILGASGYGGGELWRLLLAHPRVRSITGVARTHAGKAVGAVHGHLNGLVDGLLAGEIDWDALAAAPAPVLFAALPHGEFAKLWRDTAAHIEARGLTDRLRVIDLSGDFRLRTAKAFAEAYETEHPCPEALGTFAYGVSEWNAAALHNARRIAGPGCFATAIQLALLPLVDSGVGFVAVSGVTGSSGSGASLSATAHHPGRNNDFRTYKALGHQHRGEVAMMLAALGDGALRPAFVPHSGPFVRGIFVTAIFEPPAGFDVRAAVTARYARTPFVRVVADTPRLLNVGGTNFADIAAGARDGAGVITVAIDNLGKGMAGAAVQNMNIACGFAWDAGLRIAAPFPY